MRPILLALTLGFWLTAFSQEERDTLLNRCPVFITDTVSTNNFFLEFQPSTIKVYRVKGKLMIQVAQKDQFFTLFFPDKKLRNTKYRISADARGKSEAEAKYSFRSGTSASFVDVSSGHIESSWDEETEQWHIKVNGMLANHVERSVTYYKVRADLWVR